jgi:hypothetical protein
MSGLGARADIGRRYGLDGSVAFDPFQTWSAVPRSWGTLDLVVFILDVNQDYQPWLVERMRLFAAENTVDRQAGFSVCLRPNGLRSETGEAFNMLICIKVARSR